MRQRLVRSSGSSQLDRMMWVVRSDEGGDGRTKMGMNPDKAGQSTPAVLVTSPTRLQEPYTFNGLDANKL